MNGLILIIPFLLIRFTLLSYLNKSAIKRAAHFAPTQGYEVYAYYIYQLSNIAIFVYLCFVSVIIEQSLTFIVGSVLYAIGLLLCSITMMNFASPSESGVNIQGIYRFSRNPMYVSYFVCFLGCSLLTQSYTLLIIVMVFQISSHWIILAEERWCIENYKETYIQYMKELRRYI